jgi:hypothetical protein
MLREFKVPSLKFKVAESERTTDIGMSGQAANRRYAWLRLVTGSYG